ncbi:MAG: drug/metabolite transporter (DMT)-like permease [Yoonia sp.]
MIAVLAGVIFLAEPLSFRLIMAGLLVLGGIAVSNVRWAPTGRS